MKTIKAYICGVATMAAVMFTGCNQFDEIGSAQRVQGVDVTIDLNQAVGRATGELIFDCETTVKINNYVEGLEYVKVFTGSQCVVRDLVPGVYTITVGGKAHNEDGDEFLLAGTVTNFSVQPSNANVASTAGENPMLMIPVEVQGSLKGSLVFTEIYYCGSKPPVGFSWFRDQFYEIANNTNEVQYLDGLHFAHTDAISFDKVRPILPEADGDRYIYVDRVWKIPGTGKQYPLQPGESCVIAQFAANHKLEIYNPNSPVDLSGAEFEFSMNNVSYPDQPAFNMEHVYYDGSAVMTGMQYLTSVFGTGYVIFRIPDDEVWDPVLNTDLQCKNAADSWSDIYAKVPREYVVDVVEGIRNESYVDAKNIPATLDAGFITIGDIYVGLGVTRKRDYDSPATNGAILYQDTNNSTEDFECGVVPVPHRYSKMPSWNHTKN